MFYTTDVLELQLGGYTWTSSYTEIIHIWILQTAMCTLPNINASRIMCRLQLKGEKFASLKMIKSQFMPWNTEPGASRVFQHRVFTCKAKQNKNIFSHYENNGTTMNEKYQYWTQGNYSFASIFLYISLSICKCIRIGKCVILQGNMQRM